MTGGPSREGSPEVLAGSRFLECWPLREALRTLGWTLLAVACLALSSPAATVLFSPDGASLEPGQTRALDTLSLAFSLAGFLLHALAGRVRSRRRLPITRGAAVLGAASILGALALAEVAARVRGLGEWGSAVRTPLPVSSMREADEQNLRPGTYASTVADDFRPGRPRIVFYSINRLGLRGRAPVVPKPAGLVRILCLGGSTTFGYHVTDGEEWPARLGEALAREGRIEVVNAGRPGATTWTDFRALRDRLVQLEPDIVVLYEGFNDLWRGVRRHAAVQSDYGTVEEGLPPLREPLDLGPPRRWPLRPSFFAYLVGRRAEHLLHETSVRPAPALTQLYDPAIVGIFGANLGAMVRLCRAHGMVPVVAVFAACDDAAAPADELRRRFEYVAQEIPPLDAPTALRGFHLYREQARLVGRQERATVVDLARLMPKDTAFYSDTVHFTVDGERRVAQLLASALESDPAVRLRLTGAAASSRP
jgi:lysophospholipase L1-like esterase